LRNAHESWVMGHDSIPDEFVQIIIYDSKQVYDWGELTSGGLRESEFLYRTDLV
jgi:hypothetical protein